jgi:hypothetical protein
MSTPEQRNELERISHLEAGQQAAANDIRRIVSVLEVLAGYLGIPLPPDVPAAAPAEPVYAPLRLVGGDR